MKDLCETHETRAGCLQKNLISVPEIYNIYIFACDSPKIYKKRI